MVSVFFAVASGGLFGAWAALPFDFNVVLFSKFINLNTFGGQLLLSLCNQFFQLFLCIVQLWQNTFHCSLTQYAANQSKTFAILFHRFKCIDDRSVENKSISIFGHRRIPHHVRTKNKWFLSEIVFATENSVWTLWGYDRNLLVGTHLCSFKSSSNVEILLTIFRCSFRNACNSFSIFACSFSVFDDSAAMFPALNLWSNRFGERKNELIQQKKRGRNTYTQNSMTKTQCFQYCVYFT